MIICGYKSTIINEYVVVVDDNSIEYKLETDLYSLFCQETNSGSFVARFHLISEEIVEKSSGYLNNFKELVAEAIGQVILTKVIDS